MKERKHIPLLLLLLISFSTVSLKAELKKPKQREYTVEDSIPRVDTTLVETSKRARKSKQATPKDSATIIADTIIVIATPDTLGTTEFVPDPMKSLWYSILVPGMGQIYNKKYWKLPILYGGFIGCAYALTWNGQKYSEYAKEYQKVMTDPNAMDEYAPGTDKKWLTDMLKRKKDMFGKNRDMSVLAMIIVYGVGILDAYVDASLYHFDMSPNLALKVRPAIIVTTPNYMDIALGVSCSVSF